MHESSVSLPEEVIERLYRQTLRESDLEPDQLSATSFRTALARSVDIVFQRPNLARRTGIGIWIACNSRISRWRARVATAMNGRGLDSSKS